MAKITNAINLAQAAFLVAKNATLPGNSGTTHQDYPFLMLLPIHKDRRNARGTFQNIIATPGHPINQAMPSTENPMITKNLMNLLMFQPVAMFHQHTIHH